MKKVFLCMSLALCLVPGTLFAQSDDHPENETFEARVLKVLEEKTVTRENGSQVTQQNIKLKALSGSWKGEEILYHGISDIDVLSFSNNIFKEGDRVVMNSSKDPDGNDQFYIMNYVRRGYIYLLGAIFAVAIVFVGKKKGVRSMLSLVVSFFVITWFIIPRIAAGSNPLVVSLVGSMLILGFIIYITDGINRKTHIAILSIACALVITFVFSLIFVKLCKLTGFASEEASFLVGMPGSNIIDFRGLLLAGILIGTLGVLDDVILGQIEAVNQITTLNPHLSKKRIIKSAGEIGRTHLGAMINTLFLTYAGASLPLLILFSLSPEASVSFGSAIDNEFIATEIVRTLAGSIGLTLAFPISTIFATYFLLPKKGKTKGAAS